MPEELSFASFLNARMKECGVTMPKLSELSGIAVKYLERITKGDYANFPPAPYLRGYLQSLGKVLDFDPEPWWQMFRDGKLVPSSGHADALPQNRFAKKMRGTLVAAVVAAVLLVVYGGMRFYAILGKPQIFITAPASTTAVATEGEVVLQGRAVRADSFSINGEEVPLDADGLFEKRVVLQPGLNTFSFAAKKFLGQETEETRQVYFEAATSTATSTFSATSTSSATTTSP